MRLELFFSILSAVDCLRILSVLPSPTKSHYLPGRRIILELVNRGHEVVSISPFEEQPRNNFTWIEVEVRSIFDAVPKLREQFGEEYSFVGYQKFVWSTMNAYVCYITRQRKLASFLLHDTSLFDVIFVHEFFMPIFYVLGFKYHAPIVAISTFGYGYYIDRFMNNDFDSGVLHEFSRLKLPLNIFGTIQNIFYKYFDVFGRKFYLHEYQNELVSEIFGLEKVPDLEELERDINVMLVNSHYSTSMVRVNAPNVVEVGGVHIEDVKPLNSELKNILDNAKDGAILLSLGSFIEFQSQNKEFVSIIIKVLSSLKQKVIMKWTTDRDLSMYNNLYVYSWLPQSDILAHSNLLLFISHGGMLSNHESVFHGVPMVCIPFQANQPMVCETNARLGYAVHIPKDELSVERLNSSIHTLLSNNSFKEKVLEISRRFKDRALSPVDTAVFWIEYCARHKDIFKRNVDGNFVLYTWVLLIVILCVILCIFIRCKNKVQKIKEF